MQGRLRSEKLTVHIDSECKHCSRALVIEVNDELTYNVLSAGASPLLFEPDIKWNAFSSANIIRDY